MPYAGASGIPDRPAVSSEADSERRSRPVALFLTADTGGGHRSASTAVAEALTTRDARWRTITFDPLTGTTAPRPLRRCFRWYGPLTGRLPALWAALFYLTQLRSMRWLLRLLLAALVGRSVEGVLRQHRPAAVVVCHPLLVDVAVRARARAAHRCTLLVLVTDLASAHHTWWHQKVDHTLTPSPQLLRMARHHRSARPYPHPLGVPVQAAFGPDSAPSAAHRPMSDGRRSRFRVLVTAGGEGGRGLLRWTHAILDGLSTVDVVVVCGRNERRRRDLARLHEHAAYRHRIQVVGMVDSMAEWLRQADVVVTKAGPSIICEALAVGTPLLLAGHIPGQEAGNTEYAVATGAARSVGSDQELLGQIEELRCNRDQREAMRAAAFHHQGIDAAARVSDLVALFASQPRDEPLVYVVSTPDAAPSSSGRTRSPAPPGAAPQIRSR